LFRLAPNRCAGAGAGAGADAGAGGDRAGLGGLSVYLHMYHFKTIGKDDNNLDLHTYTGFFVGLLLVFRTNIAYSECSSLGWLARTNILQHAFSY
jgi:hypothetical protein